MNEGVCRGGPLSGQTVTSRRRAGFVLVDAPRDRGWIYDWVEEASGFTIREEKPRRLNHQYIVEALESGDYDELAFPDGEYVNP